MADLIASVWSGHDASFYLADGGRPLLHCELERYLREKEPYGDSIEFMEQVVGKSGDLERIKHLALIYPRRYLDHFSDSWQRMEERLVRSGGQVHWVGHHRAHCANTFFSSNFQKAAVVAFDGGGVEEGDVETALMFCRGEGTRIEHQATIPISTINIGGLWTRCTRYIFKLNSGWPGGHSAGTVMAMAALGDPLKYRDDFWKMLTEDITAASVKPLGQPKGNVDLENEVRHPYLDPWARLAEEGDQEKFDLAAGLQQASEELIRDIVTRAILYNPDCTDVCLSGGVALNSVAMGKLFDWFPGYRFYVTPTPHDGGLTIGAAQYVWHHVLGNPREEWAGSFTPYLGVDYDLESELTWKTFGKGVTLGRATDHDVIDLLAVGKIVSVFRGRAESGRRALGNRSILADPRPHDMKARINEQVKHRQWFRPFAPAILREDVADWFEFDVDSPYMSFVGKFKEGVRDRVPAAVHLDGTGRLQTVRKEENPWFHGFLSQWKERTGVPILINTSFNDREPIVETVEHAVDCMLRTDIDAMYLPEVGSLGGILVRRKQ